MCPLGRGEIMFPAVGNGFIGWMAEMFRGSRTRRRAVPAQLLEQRTLLAAFVVTSAADNTTVDGLTTLREAVILANGSAGANTITFGMARSVSGGTNFTDGTADTITLSLGQMTITGTVTITGNHANLSQGGGIFSYAAPVTIQNSIVAGNTDNSIATPNPVMPIALAAPVSNLLHRR